MAKSVDRSDGKRVVRLLTAYISLFEHDNGAKGLLKIFEKPDVACPLTGGKRVEEYVDHFRSKQYLVDYGCFMFLTWLENLFLYISEPVVSLNDGSTWMVRKTDFVTLKDWFEELRSLLERCIAIFMLLEGR